MAKSSPRAKGGTKGLMVLKAGKGKDAGLCSLGEVPWWQGSISPVL